MPQQEGADAMEANARLIAAAPETKAQRDELLEAAKTVLHGLQARIAAARDETPVFDGIAALHDAIAKAEGRHV
ncbi:MAG: hypothetical protein ACM3W4_01685 [Ignavibacteriales bacterium]